MWKFNVEDEVTDIITIPGDLDGDESDEVLVSSISSMGCVPGGLETVIRGGLLGALES